MAPFQGQCEYDRSCVCCTWYIKFLVKERWCPAIRGCRRWCRRKAKKGGYSMSKATCLGSKCICILSKMKYFELPDPWSWYVQCPANQTTTTTNGTLWVWAINNCINMPETVLLNPMLFFHFYCFHNTTITKNCFFFSLFLLPIMILSALLCFLLHPLDNFHAIQGLQTDKTTAYKYQSNVLRPAV